MTKVAFVLWIFGFLITQGGTLLSLSQDIVSSWGTLLHGCRVHEYFYHNYAPQRLTVNHVDKYWTVPEKSRLTQKTINSLYQRYRELVNDDVENSLDAFIQFYIDFKYAQNDLAEFNSNLKESGKDFSKFKNDCKNLRMKLAEFYTDYENLEKKFSQFYTHYENSRKTFSEKHLSQIKTDYNNSVEKFSIFYNQYKSSEIKLIDINGDYKNLEEEFSNFFAKYRKPEDKFCKIHNHLKEPGVNFSDLCTNYKELKNTSSKFYTDENSGKKFSDFIVDYKNLEKELSKFVTSYGILGKEVSTFMDETLNTTFSFFQADYISNEKMYNSELKFFEFGSKNNFVQFYTDSKIFWEKVFKLFESLKISEKRISEFHTDFENLEKKFAEFYNDYKKSGEEFLDFFTTIAYTPSYPATRRDIRLSLDFLGRNLGNKFNTRRYFRNVPRSAVSGYIAAANYDTDYVARVKSGEEFNNPMNAEFENSQPVQHVAAVIRFEYIYEEISKGSHLVEKSDGSSHEGFLVADFGEGLDTPVIIMKEQHQVSTPLDKKNVAYNKQKDRFVFQLAGKHKDHILVRKYNAQSPHTLKDEYIIRISNSYCSYMRDIERKALVSLGQNVGVRRIQNGVVSAEMRINFASKTIELINKEAEYSLDIPEVKNILANRDVRTLKSPSKKKRKRTELIDIEPKITAFQRIQSMLDQGEDFFAKKIEIIEKMAADEDFFTSVKAMMEDS